MDKILLPLEEKQVEGSVIFLAGPVTGAENWQNDAAKAIQGLSKDIYIANPRKEWNKGEYVYEPFMDWELYYLERAAKKGVILFWLGNEKTHDCKRPFAQTCRFELGEWITKHIKDNVNVVIGIDTDFSGSVYVERRIKKDCPDLPVVYSLEEACEIAVKMCE